MLKLIFGPLLLVGLLLSQAHAGGMRNPYVRAGAEAPASGTAAAAAKPAAPAEKAPAINTASLRLEGMRGDLALVSVKDSGGTALFPLRNGQQWVLQGQEFDVQLTSQPFPQVLLLQDGRIRAVISPTEQADARSR